VNPVESELESLRQRLSDADELVRAIHDGEVDAFVLRHRDSYKIHALQDADTAYRVLVEGMRQGAATIASNGTILYANRRLCEMLGSSAEAIVGHSVTDCFGFDSETIRALLRSAVEGEAPGEFLIRSGEQTIVAVISAYPLEAEGRNPIFCLVISDVSDKKAAEKQQAALAEERAELTGIFSKLPFAVFVADPRGGIYYVNEIGEKLATSQGMLDKVQSFASELQGDGPAHPIEIEVKDGDGSTACYRLYANAVRAPFKAARAVVVAMDVKHEREAQKRRERDDQLRETFMAILGHDLRTPLSAVQVAGGLLKRRASTAEDAKLADMILRATQRMKALTDDMLDLASSRLGQGIPVDPVEADLAQIVTTITEELSGGARADFVTDLVGDTRGRWDPSRLTQVLSNLLSNAVSYGESGKAIHVRVDGRAGDEVTIEVTNQGKPIPADLLPVLFDPFRRGHGRSPENKGGVGLGLHIAGQIVEAHGGKIEVRSGRDEGTTFTVRLPRWSRGREER
jgi:PAS domain S-box-containing protein